MRVFVALVEGRHSHSQLNADLSQPTYNAKITSLSRRNDVATSFCRHNDIIIALCARWECQMDHQKLTHVKF